MKFKKTLFFLSIIALFSSNLGGISYEPKIAYAQENSDYLSKTINIGEYVSINSSGGSFYLSFNKHQDVGETARFSYIIDQFDVDNDALKNNAGFFLSDASSVAKSYIDDSGTNYKSFADVINDSTLATPNSVDEIKYACFKEKIFTSILPVAVGSNVNVIVRNGVYDYSQVTLGDNFNDRKIDDGCCYGYYFDGIDIKMSFLLGFLFPNQSLTIYYRDGVDISVNDEAINPTIKSETFTVLDVKDDSIWSPGSLPFYNSSLAYIPFSKNPVEKGYIVEYDHIEINDQKSSASLISDGSRYYVVCKLSSIDTLNVISSSRVGNEDENVTIHDLYDVSNQVSITYNGNDVFNTSENGKIGLGNIPNSVNNAFRFNITLSSYHYTKFGIWTSNSGLWSNFGYIIRFGPDKHVYILNGEEIEYAKGANDSVVPGNTFSVVVGLCKISDENNHWYANRIYVDINGERTVEYNDFERCSLGSAIIAPYFDALNLTVTFKDYRLNELVKVNYENNEHVQTNSPSYVLKGQPATFSFKLDEDYKFNTFKCNGEDILSKLTLVNGIYIYIYEVDNDDSAIDFSYTLIDNVSVSLSLSGSFVEANYDTNPLYGSRPTISFTLLDGKSPSSIKVNGIEKVESVYRYNKIYHLDLDALTDDTIVNIECEDKNYAVTYLNNDNSHVTVSFEKELVPIGGSTRINIVLEYGYLIDNLQIEGEATLFTYGGAYFIEDVYSDIKVNITTKKEEEIANEPVNEFDWATCVSIIIYSLSSVVFVALLVSSLILRKKVNK